MCSVVSFNFVKLHPDASAYCNKDIAGFVVCDLLVEGVNLTTWSLPSKAYLWPEIHVKLVDFEVVNSYNGLPCFLERCSMIQSRFAIQLLVNTSSIHKHVIELEDDICFWISGW